MTLAAISSADPRCRRLLDSWPDSLAGVLPVLMPPTWRDEGPVPYTFVFTRQELAAEEFERVYRDAVGAGLENVRLFTPRALELASVFHPRFAAALLKDADRFPQAGLSHGLSERLRGRLICETSPGVQAGTTRFWLQSMLFLAGVTLSAAIIQNRWSSGTVDSKLGRLWQAGCVAETGGFPSLNAMKLCQRVRELALSPQPAVRRLNEIKTLYAEALEALTEGIPAVPTEMTVAPLRGAMKSRFGFVSDLRHTLGKNLKAVLVYGSSVAGSAFSDYDVILVVKSSRDALDRLAGTAPVYQGLELNLSVYNEKDFWTYQVLSGDNLTTHALCLYGAVLVPEKSRNDLLARNFSFGFVRLRQLLGMAAFALQQPVHDPADDKANLYGYFVKIPLNVVRGIRGALGECTTKEEVQTWCRTRLGYDVAEQKRRCVHDPGALAAAAWGTLRVLEASNQELQIHGPAGETIPAGRNPDAGNIITPTS